MMNPATHTPAGRAAPARHLPRPAGSWVRREAPLMGTAVSVQLWCTQRSRGEAAAAAVLAEVHRHHRALSPRHAGSELSRINREAAHRAMTLAVELLGRVAGTQPDRDAGSWRRQPLPLPVGSPALTLLPASQGAPSERGEVAHGHAVDCCAALLHAHGVAQAMVRVGAASRAIGCGNAAHGHPCWRVAVPHPLQRAARLGVRVAAGTAVSTVQRDAWCPAPGSGRTRPTTQPPQPGSGPPDLHSVTVLAGDGLGSATLARAVFMLGLGHALALLDSMAGAQLLVFDDQGGVHATAGLPFD